MCKFELWGLRCKFELWGLSCISQVISGSCRFLQNQIIMSFSWIFQFACLYTSPHTLNVYIHIRKYLHTMQYYDMYRTWILGCRPAGWLPHCPVIGRYIIWLNHTVRQSGLVQTNYFIKSFILYLIWIQQYDKMYSTRK